MQVVLRLERFQFKDEKNDWYVNSGFLEVLIEFFQQTEYGSKARYYYRFRDDKIQKMASFTDAIAIIKENKVDSYVFSEVQSKTSDWNLMLVITEFGFEIVLSEFISDRRALGKKIGIMVDVTLDLHKIFKEAAYLGNRIGIELYNVEGYEPDYNKLNESWEGFHIVDFISESGTVHSDPRIRIANVIKKVPLPPDASFSKKNELIIIHWSEKFSDEKTIAAVMKKRDQWLYDNLQN